MFCKLPTRVGRIAGGVISSILVIGAFAMPTLSPAATGAAPAQTPAVAKPTRAGSASPAEIFAAMKAASGGARWDEIGEIDLRADTTQGGETGHTEMQIDLRDGRSSTHYDLGGVSGGEGFDGTHSWLLDEKNLVSLRDSPQTLRQAATDRYIARNGWFDAPARASAAMEFVGPRDEAGHAYLVLQITPGGGVPFYAWIDAGTHLLDRIVQTDDSGATTTTHYSDYRKVDGLRLAYLQRSGNGDSQFDSATTVTQYTLLAQADASHFVVPESQVHDAHIQGGAASAKVPFEPYDGLILLQLQIDGHAPLPFILDTGGLNLLTPQAARALGIDGSGNQAVHGAGEAVQAMQTAQIKHFSLGAVELDAQRFLIVELPLLLTDRGARTPIAGLIGYEVLRRFATRIDYDQHTLTLEPNTSFHYRGNGQRLPLVFDDRTPQIEATINGARGEFALDTGDAGELTVLGPFASAHGIVARGAAEASQSHGVGGKITDTLTRLDVLKIGDFSIARPLTSLSAPKAGAFASSVLAGNIGHGILARFVSTFDYEHRQVFFERGTRFEHVTPGDRSGLGLDRDRHDSVVVASVTVDSPAAKAGLQVGDRITAIDNVPVAELGLDDLKRCTRRPTATVLTLGVERAGVAKQIKLTLGLDLLP